MVVFPHCKINIGLNIVEKRTDGYHNIETVFFPVPLYDVLEIIPSIGESTVQFTQSGRPIAGKPEDNSCITAYKKLKHYLPQLPNILMHLHKNIPTGAGLGGGSADAAFVLKLINKKLHEKLDLQWLSQIALELGSDCPYFLYNGPCFATSRGEKLEPVTLSLNQYSLLLVNPDIEIATKNIFEKITPAKPNICIKEIVTQPIDTWKGLLKNDFEPTVFELFPEIEKIKLKLYQHGAIYASLTGTGSTVYGIFEKGFSNTPTFPENYFVKLLHDMR